MAIIFTINTKTTDESGPGNDAPDDNYSVATADYSTTWLFEPNSKNGVLTSGFYGGLNCLLGKCKISTTVVGGDLTVLGTSERELHDLDVLFLASGGLVGLETSITLKNKLSDFVQQGGTLITLAAQNGSEFAALPGGNVTGYGWTEDQSCLNGAVSMVNYHQMLSGQTSTNIDVNVDGYFTKWSANATVLLQRNKNGMPALITYPYGKGTVIATTIFEDWAYGHNQSTTSGQKLIRDMVAWAIMAIVKDPPVVFSELSV